MPSMGARAMELRHLRYFLAVAEEMNFTAAARRTHVTQSTLSHQIRQLEEEIGQPLFERGPRKLALTHAGESFFATAMRAINEVDQGLLQLRSHRALPTRELRVGTTQTMNVQVMPATLAGFVGAHPATALVVEEYTHDGVADHVASGALDLGLTSLPTLRAGLDVELLGQEELVLVVHPRHRFARRRRVRMIELHRQDMVLYTRRYATRLLLDSLFARIGAQPLVRIETVSTLLILETVRSTELCSIVSRLSLAHTSGLVAVPLEGPAPVREMGLIWPAAQPRSAEMDAFAAIARGVVAQLVRRKLGLRPP